MIEVYSAKQAAEIDSIAIEERGFERTILMENAGRSVAEAIFNLDIERRSAAVICGKGHNGGDGIVAARHLRENGWEVLVVFIEDPEDFAPDTKYFFDLLVELDSGVSFFQYKDTDQLTELLEDCHLIIDAIFGTGFRGNLTMPYDEIILTLNDQYAMRVAIDIPSGINAGTGYGTIAFKAHWTVALGTHKLGYYYGEGINHCGTILNGFIGFNNSRMGVETNWSVYELPDTKSIIAPKKRTVNKYTAGGPVIVSGSNRYPGAATLTYQGAFFSGSGSPIIITSERAANVLLGHLPEAVVKDYPVAFNSEALKMMFEALEKKEVLLVGPGLDRSPETTLALEKIYNIEDRLVILDADGLFPLFNGNYKNYDLEGKIILPHTGEFANILGKPLDEIEEDIFSEVTDFCEQTGAIVVLKHAAVFVCTSIGINLILNTGGVHLAKFGTGDALAGVIASAMAQFFCLPNLTIEGIMPFLRIRDRDALEVVSAKIADAVNTFNFSALMLLKDSPNTHISASVIATHLPAAIKMINETND